MKSFHKQAGYTLTELITVLIVLPLFLAVPAGWVTHVVHCLQNEEWILLIVGAIFFPIGIVHGIGLWFGVF